MKCPACSSVLITLEFDGFEIDRCFKCDGIWLDSGELEGLVGPEGGDEYLRSMKRLDCIEVHRECPICSTEMTKMTIGVKGIVLDICRDHGIWFDSGELVKVLSESQTDESGRLVNMLKEMLSGNRS